MTGLASGGISPLENPPADPFCLAKSLSSTTAQLHCWAIALAPARGTSRGLVLLQFSQRVLIRNLSACFEIFLFSIDTSSYSVRCIVDLLGSTSPTTFILRLFYVAWTILSMPRNKVGKRKDPPVFRKPFPPVSPDKTMVAPDDHTPPQPDPKTTKMKTIFGKTLASMDLNDLKNLLDDCMAKSLVPKEPVDPAIDKRLARNSRQWEQPFEVPEIPGYTASKEQGERKIKRFRRSLVQIILDEATEDDASARTLEVQHHLYSDPSTNPTAVERVGFELN
ncbi:hypothetical protein FS837_011149 [Tulasnella sp. UAMH 9824]|nr:hypothetical protein FS837_011149 [Tulasnella sp. UAMH 9824]